MKYFAMPLLSSLLAISSAHASPDATGDAIAKQCPGAQQWEDQQKAAHAQSSFGPDAAQRDAGRRFTQAPLRAELLRREHSDEQARTMLINAGAQATAQQRQAVLSVDQDNLRWMQHTFQGQALPDVAAVGELGLHALFVLVQHADTDAAFQARMLALFKPRLGKGGIEPADYAMLTDRVLRKQGKPQLYGSQFEGDPSKPGSYKLQPLQDPQHVDQRRAQMGLMPMAAYTCVIHVLYNGSAYNTQAAP